ncbi:MAG: transcriptional regulator, IclR family [Sphingomonadales bacterium]|nr:transcriptional regulator, IclR family [Sphingomonadales bacterium]
MARTNSDIIVPGDDRKVERPAAMKQADFVSSFARGLETLKIFSAEQPRHSIASAATATGMNRAATRRILLTLVELGYAFMEDELFELTPKVLELGHAYLSSWQVVDLVRPSLKTVVDAVQENCSMGVLDGGNVVYIARSEMRRIVQSAIISVGSRIPTNVASMGRAILSQRTEAFVSDYLIRYPLQRFTDQTVMSRRKFIEMLAVTRKQGWCLVEGEFEVGLMSLAVPVLDLKGDAVAAINVGAPTSRATRDDMIERFLPPLLAASKTISRSLNLSDRHPADIILSMNGQSEN